MAWKRILIIFLIKLNILIISEPKKAKITVNKTIIAPIATPGPAYA